MVISAAIWGEWAGIVATYGTHNRNGWEMSLTKQQQRYYTPTWNIFALRQKVNGHANRLTAVVGKVIQLGRRRELAAGSLLAQKNTRVGRSLNSRRAHNEVRNPA